jgi:YesN/AraC family two-component response regulator
VEGRDAIVCVDDEAIILLSLRMELKRYFKGRYRVETASNAEDALALVDSLYADGFRVILILTDWLMPGIRGDELVSIVKESHPDVHCIMISGQMDEASFAKAKAGNLLDAFLRKPWHSKGLIDSILGCIDGEDRTDTDESGRPS